MRVYRSRKRYRTERLLRRAVFCLCIMMICGVAWLGTVCVVKGKTWVPLPDGKETVSSVIRTAKPAENPPVSAAPEAVVPPAKDSAPQGQKEIAPPIEKKDDSAFCDAVFIGDSRTQALQTYGVMKCATYYTMKGLMVSTVSTKPVVKLENGQRVSVMEAMQKKQFGKVYIMLGVNELGWSSSQTFINTYGDVLDKIKKYQPHAQVYVQSILPVSEKKSKEDTIYNNEKINRYNDMIQKLAKEKAVHYIAVNKALMDKDGALPAEASADGVHPNKEYCQKWVAYLKDHLADA